MLPALVLFSHGSLLCGSESLLNAHVLRIRDSSRFCVVEAGYLNYSYPAIEVAIERCIAAGATEVVIVPYFLVAGKFVTVDLPARLESALSSHPHIRFHIARAIEDSAGLPGAIVEAAAVAVPVSQWQLSAIHGARLACELRTDCPLYNTPMCRAGQA